MSIVEELLIASDCFGVSVLHMTEHEFLTVTEAIKEKMERLHAGSLYGTHHG